jgi:hypothetical protein
VDERWETIFRVLRYFGSKNAHKKTFGKRMRSLCVFPFVRFSNKKKVNVGRIKLL